MKNKILIALLLICYSLLQGCANFKYPGWSSVKIEESIIGKPCLLRGKQETCNGESFKCKTWFQKRATLVGANTVVLVPITTRTLGKYYNCQVGFPPYEAVKFTKEGYTQGENTVSGQAFLKQQGGGVVTCAGNIVEIYPNNAYFRAARQDGAHEVEKSLKADSMVKTTLCDALGNFEFTNIPDGEWRIETTVQWYVNNRPQGGTMREDVTVKSNERNRFIISR